MTPAPSPQLLRAAEAVLRGNDRGGYTLPSADLYPFQWNWDSAFIALGWAACDESRAWRELETLFAAQWPDGMVPHIVFHGRAGRYFPGPEVWRTEREPPTSGITQPPVAASCVRWIFERARDRTLAEAAVKRLLPKLFAWHRWFHRLRDPERLGVVHIVHPWESGMDNSPAFDAPLAAVPVEDLEPYERRDLEHVPPEQRPTRLEYDRYLALLRVFRDCGWRAREVVRQSPFLVADVGVNMILHRADRDLLALAREFGAREMVAALEEWMATGRQGMERCLRDPETGFYHPRDARRGLRLAASTHAAFLAFWAGIGDDLLARRLERWLAATRFGLSSVAADDPAFDPDRYWRGPVWAITNFMIAQGLEEYGRSDLARRLRADTRVLIQRSGFREYFHPQDGRGLGGRAFSWTAAVLLAEQAG